MPSNHFQGYSFKVEVEPLPEKARNYGLLGKAVLHPKTPSTKTAFGNGPLYLPIVEGLDGNNHILTEEEVRGMRSTKVRAVQTVTEKLAKLLNESPFQTWEDLAPTLSFSTRVRTEPLRIRTARGRISQIRIPSESKD
jgi:hypothetical protein